MKDRETLRRELGSFERFARWGAYAIVVGIVGEGVFAYLTRSGKDPWLIWTPVVLDGLVALGIAVEVIFARMAGDRQAELTQLSNQDAANALSAATEAQDRLTEAQLELARLSWRRLDARVVSKLSRDLVGLGIISIQFTHLRNDEESKNLAEQIGGVFKGLSCKVGYKECIYSMYPGQNLEGIRVPTRHDAEGYRLAAKIREIFEGAEIRTVPQNAPMPHLCTESGDALTAPIVEIFIGRKKPPAIE